MSKQTELAQLADVVTVDGSNVGIGTSSPSNYYANSLVVDTDSSVQSGITIVSDTNNSGMFAFADGTSGDQRYRGYLNYNHSNDSLTIGTAGGAGFTTLDASGNVGISTDSPDAKLHVAGNTKLGSASHQTWTDNGDDIGGLDIFVGSGSKALTVWDDNRQSAPRFQVDRDGQVGIGRAPTSSYKLDVHEELSGNWLAHIHNSHATNGYGVKIRAGDDNNVSAFRVSSQDNATTILDCTGGGIVTTPNQPAFSAINNTAGQNNMATNTYHTVVFGGEIFDQGSDFTNNTFTAPVTGRYQFNVKIRLYQLDTAATYYQSILVTSNRAYELGLLSPKFTSDFEYFTFTTSILADMDAADTAYVQFYQHLGSAQTDLQQANAIFSGYLVA